MDDVPVARAPEPPRPTRATLVTLVGRVTTIKLAYWAALTAFEAVLPVVDPRPLADRLPLSLAAAIVLSAAAGAWARRSARTPDRNAGVLERSVPTIATTFAATTVVASPASLPLLILERQRSLEACAVGTCHAEPLLLWVAVLAFGTLAIPAAFAWSLRRTNARSVGG